MRVIAGTIGGQLFDAPKNRKTHPMSENIRGALFNTLGDIAGLTVLDAYAGSGAVGFEAVSRGASNVLLIESDRLAQKVILTNIERLRVEANVKLVRASVGAWLTTSETVYDIVICDPPYDAPGIELLYRMSERVKTSGLYVVSLPATLHFQVQNQLLPVSEKIYGNAKLLFFRKK